MGLGIFLASIILVSFISLCFLKKRFWENRYLVLFISGCVALVATLSTNYATRGRLDTSVETIFNIPIQVMNFNAALIDSCGFTTDEELSFDEHLYSEDTTVVSKYSHYMFYHGDDGLRIGFAYDDDTKSKYLKNMYIVESDTDTTGYFTKKRLRYADRDSKWIADFSLPHLKTIKCLYLPPTEYAMIPDSLIRELPF